MSKIELVRSIILQPDGVRINLTMKKGESYQLIDTITINNVGKIYTIAQVHCIDLISRRIHGISKNIK